MNALERLRFLWEEPTAPAGEVPTVQSAGVPRPLRKATRIALIGFAAVSLMGQVIQVRLVAPVDAAPSYTAQCIQTQCKGLTGQARAACNHRCQGKTP